jgi:methyl-accepting chemotaxis protein
MFSLMRSRRAEREPAPSLVPPVQPLAPDASQDLVALISRHASTMGREAAEVRGAIDDASKVATAQAQALHALADEVQQVTQAQSRITQRSRDSHEAVARAGQAVQAVGDEVSGIVDTLRQVGDAAQEITQVALQTRLVAFNASVEAKRAGDAGRGFGVVADAVKDLASRVEASSKAIMGTMGQLDARIAALAREIQTRPSAAAGGESGAVQASLDEVRDVVAGIDVAAGQSQAVCTALDARMRALEAEMNRTTQQLDGTLGRTESFLEVSEQMIEMVAGAGIETEDTPYIQAAQQAAAQIAELLDEALRSGRIDATALFDERYEAIAGSDPQQHRTRFVELAEHLFPAVQEPMLKLSGKVVFCIAVDRNGYIPCHNQAYNHPQRAGDTAWNTAHCRNRRIFADRTGLASARNQRPFLLQTYRRDMGGGNFVVMKEAAAPISVAGRHWGGLRLAFKF